MDDYNEESRLLQKKTGAKGAKRFFAKQRSENEA